VPHVCGGSRELTKLQASLHFDHCTSHSVEKQRFSELARQRGLTEGQLALLAVRTCLDLAHGAPTAPTQMARDPCTDRITIRLRPGDRKNIEWRARERGELPSVYIAALVRSHITAAPPLVRDEMLALKASAAVLSGTLQGLRRTGSALPTQADAGLKSALAEVEGAVRTLEQDTRMFIEKALASWETYIRD
jgi:hypothetical protein